MKISMTADDFQRLTENSMRWAGTDWEAQAERFETTGDDEVIRWDWKMTYGVGQSYAAVILARAFLAAEGYDCQVIWDMAEWPNGEFIGYTILTDYESPVWQTIPADAGGIAIRADADAVTEHYDEEA